MLRGLFPLLFCALAIAGCGFLSDFHTGGYNLVDSGSGCTSAGDCDGGEVCCVSTLEPALATCRSAPCPDVSGVSFPAQLCQTNGECGSVECLEQSCAGISIMACGVISMCTATPLDGSLALDSAVLPPTDAAQPSPFDASSGSSD
jgi:hypothetical protein